MKLYLIRIHFPKYPLSVLLATSVFVLLLKRPQRAFLLRPSASLPQRNMFVIVSTEFDLSTEPKNVSAVPRQHVLNKLYCCRYEISRRIQKVELLLHHSFLYPCVFLVEWDV